MVITTVAAAGAMFAAAATLISAAVATLRRTVTPQRESAARSLFAFSPAQHFNLCTHRYFVFFKGKSTGWL